MQKQHLLCHGHGDLSFLDQSHTKGINEMLLSGCDLSKFLNEGRYFVQSASNVVVCLDIFPGAFPRASIWVVFALHRFVGTSFVVGPDLGWCKNFVTIHIGTGYRSVWVGYILEKLWV